MVGTSIAKKGRSKSPFIKGFKWWCIPFTATFSVLAYCYFFVIFIWFAVWLLGLTDMKNMIPYQYKYLFPCGSIETHFRSSWFHNQFGFRNPWLTNLLLTLIFTVPHAFFARQSTKKFLREAAVGEISVYRSAYVLKATACLHFVMLNWQPIRGEPLWILTTHQWFYWPLIIQNGMGVLYLLTATFAIDHFELVGIKQAWGVDPYKSWGIETGGLITRLHYGLSRHPIMFGWFLMFWSTPVMTISRFFFAFLWTVYILYDVFYLEEPDLMKLHPEYKTYRRDTPPFCPFASIVWHKETRGTKKGKRGGRVPNKFGNTKYSQ